MNVITAPIAGVLILEPRTFSDSRGLFMETYSVGKYQGLGIDETFVQDNVSISKNGVLRGLHFQFPRAQAKLVAVLVGSIFDVIVDVRRGSPTFGRSFGTELSFENHRQLYIPEGFAHGFFVKEEDTLVQYKTSEHYDPKTEKTLLWNDPALKIDWPVPNPILSEKDQKGRLLKDFRDGDLPSYAI